RAAMTDGARRSRRSRKAQHQSRSLSWLTSPKAHPPRTPTPSREAEEAGDHSVVRWLSNSATAAMTMAPPATMVSVSGSPHQWLTSQRLSRAQELLERSDRGVEQIAAECGLIPLMLRRHFARRWGITPQAYRRRFTHLSDLAALGRARTCMRSPCGP